MPFAHFQVPASGGQIEERLNQFLGKQTILKVEKQFHGTGGEPAWLYCVEYLAAAKLKTGFAEAATEAGKPLIDYKGILNEEDFALFLKLKEWRKERAVAEKIDAYYTIFTNAQLADIAQKKCTTKEALAEIPGVGEKRIDKYGEDILKVIAS